MEYFSFGKGKKTCVILPGLSIGKVTALADQVALAYKALTEDFTVYVFERVSDVPEDYTIAGMAEDTAAAFTALGLKELYIMGASQGGMIAMQIAANYPHLVKKAVIASSSSFVTEYQRNIMKMWIGFAEKKDGEGLFLSFAQVIYPQRLFMKGKEFFADCGKTIKAEDFERFIRLARATDGFDIREQMESIQCPVLAVGSKDDKLFGPEGSLQIAEKTKDGEAYIYDGYGHALYDTAPDFKKRILEFYLK
ncbi:MAG: alpha/beta hydrolase [Clostridiales bacterium]|nr:alpha/beta hydrolase [Clostridiales bacterium]